MAKRRDSITRYTQRAVREGRASLPNLNRINQRFPNFDNDALARARMRGRRGVRARARLARIQARQANGTYTQPGGGTVTNS